MEEERKDYTYPDQEKVIMAPVPRYYALISGLGLFALGVLGMIPAFTSGGILFGLLHVSRPLNTVHILSGLLGLVVFAPRICRYARAYALFLGVVYLIVFTIGNIEFGNTEATMTAHMKVAYITANGLYAGIMLVSWLIAALGFLQSGDRATRRYRRAHPYSIWTRTRLPDS